MKFQLAAIAAVSGVLLTAANASENELNVELTPFAAYRFGGSFDVEDAETSYDIKDSPSYGFIVNFRQQANTQWEILYSRQQTEAEFSDATAGNSVLDVNIDVLQGGGTYQFHGDKVRPYLALTVGGTHVNTSAGDTSDSDTFWSGTFGMGLQIRPNERLGLRLEARIYGTFINSDTDIFCQTGPNQNVCAVRVDGTMVSQFETLAGIVFRF
jgi:opacity protein-like surface antigen